MPGQRLFRESFLNQVPERASTSASRNQHRRKLFDRESIKVGSKKGASNLSILSRRRIRGEISIMQPTRTNRQGGTPGDDLLTSSDQLHTSPTQIENSNRGRIVGCLQKLIGGSKERQCCLRVALNQMDFKTCFAENICQKLLAIFSLTNGFSSHNQYRFSSIVLSACKIVVQCRNGKLKFLGRDQASSIDALTNTHHLLLIGENIERGRQRTS